MSNSNSFSNSFGLQTVQDREEKLLAPYAMFSADSKGRKHSESAQSYRGPYQRDRDRILHSAAYRRLSGKMQVFTGDMGDYHRTRLTHTQEVASIARTVGRALRLNEDLIEALALFHDIGHPPFGHAGEDALNACLAAEGGFSHNRHALTIAEELEIRYQDFPGLNLSFEVLEGQMVRAKKNAKAAAGGDGPLLEVQVVDIADSISYSAHDTDDAVKLGLVSLEELQETALVRESLTSVRKKYASLGDARLRKAVVHELIDRQVSDVLQCSGDFLKGEPFSDAQAARRDSFRIGPSNELEEQEKELEKLLYERVYRHARLLKVRKQAQERIREMFAGYLDNKDLLPEEFQHRAVQIGLLRSVGDYLAGMTDRYCNLEYKRHFTKNGG